MKAAAGHTLRQVPAPAAELLRWSASELARHIAQGDVSAVEVAQAYLERIEQIQPQVNAFVAFRADHALQRAAELDQLRARGESAGPLHGVPFSLKECFQVRGLPSTLGVDARRNIIDEQDGPHLHRLSAAGGVLLGKTNVSQLMLFHESDNPLFGCTSNPLDLARTPGGSSGGEAAAVASFSSPLGVGNDLGGSIRLPAAWCGICGFKPTTHRLTNRGITRNFRGFQAMRSQSGPLARRVADLAIACEILFSPDDIDIPPVPWKRSADCSLSDVTVYAFDDDRYFPAAPAARRAVREAAAAFESQGLRVEWIEPEISALIDCYYGLMFADGAADARELARESRLDKRLSRMFFLGNLPGWSRWLVTAAYQGMGRRWTARLLQQARPLTAHAYWQLTDRMEQLALAFRERYLPPSRATALLTPAHALPAPRHGDSVDLLPAASYSFLANLLGTPAGVVPWTTIRPHETAGCVTGCANMDGFVNRTLKDSAGLPVPVQIIAGLWRDDLVLALLQRLEDAADQARPATASSDPGD